MKKMPELDLAIQADDWQYIEVQNPILADAIQSRVNKGDTPKEIFRYVLHKVGPAREQIALRCLHAAEYLVLEKEAGN